MFENLRYSVRLTTILDESPNLKAVFSTRYAALTACEIIDNVTRMHHDFSKWHWHGNISGQTDSSEYMSDVCNDLNDAGIYAMFGIVNQGRGQIAELYINKLPTGIILHGCEDGFDMMYIGWRDEKGTI